MYPGIRRIGPGSNATFPQFAAFDKAARSRRAQPEHRWFPECRGRVTQSAGPGISGRPSRAIYVRVGSNSSIPRCVRNVRLVCKLGNTSSVFDGVRLEVILAPQTCFSPCAQSSSVGLSLADGSVAWHKVN